MFKQIPHLLSDGQLKNVKAAIANADFRDGRISNPHSKVKNNLQLADAKAYEASAKILLDALMAHQDFRNFALPHTVTPPLVTRYTKGMAYGLHLDAATIPMPSKPIRSDLSCTIFLSDPNHYEGGALRIKLGDAELRFKGAAGSALIYPSTTLHEVERIESGERMVAIAFIQSRIADTTKRNLLYELGEVVALEGLNMREENFERLQSVQFNLGRMWMDF